MCGIVGYVGAQEAAPILLDAAPADYDISIEGVTQTGKIVQRRQRLRPE